MAIFDGRSYIFMTTISMGEAGGMLRPLAGFWFLNMSWKEYQLDNKGFPSPCGVLQS